MRVLPYHLPQSYWLGVSELCRWCISSLSHDVFPVWVLRSGSLFVLLFILSMQVCVFSVHRVPFCWGVCVCACVCVHVHMRACLLHSQRRLISPAGPVRLFLGALSSQLEATAVTCLPNISPLSSPLLSSPLLGVLHYPLTFMSAITLVKPYIPVLVLRPAQTSKRNN